MGHDYDQMKAVLAKGKRPKGMGYGDYSHLMRKAEQEPEDEDKYNDRDEDEEEAEKSIDAEALRKSMEAYDAVEDTITTESGSRESYLLTRANDATITKSERKELAQILAGAEGEPIHKSLSSRIDDDDPDSGNLVRANDFLKSLVASVDDALEAVHESVARESSGTRQLIKAQGSMVKALGGQLIELGEVLDEYRTLIKSLSGRIETVETTPVQPRAQRTVDPAAVRGRDLSKAGVAGGGGGAVQDDEDKLTKSQVLHGLRLLTMQADERGDSEAMAQITHATARVEGNFPIKRQHYDAVVQVLNA